MIRCSWKKLSVVALTTFAFCSQAIAQQSEDASWMTATWTSKDTWSSVRKELDREFEKIKKGSEHNTIRQRVASKIKESYNVVLDNPSSRSVFNLAFWSIQLTPYSNGTSLGVDKNSYKIDWDKYSVDSSKEWARLRFLHGCSYSATGPVRGVSQRVCDEFPLDRSVYHWNLIFAIASETDSAKELTILSNARNFLDTPEATPRDKYFLAYAHNLSRHTLGRNRSIIDTAILYYESYLEVEAPDHPLRKLAKYSLDNLKKC